MDFARTGLLVSTGLRLISLLAGLAFSVPYALADNAEQPWSPGNTETLPAATGEILLVLSGNLERPNAGDELHLDLALLERFPPAVFETHTPWSNGIHRFEGVWLHHLLEAAGSTSTSLHLTGYDDYAADLDLERVPATRTSIAFRHNGEPMSLRQLGPLRVIFPFDDHPELDTSANHASAVWQLTGIELR